MSRWLPKEFFSSCLGTTSGRSTREHANSCPWSAPTWKWLFWWWMAVSTGRAVPRHSLQASKLLEQWSGSSPPRKSGPKRVSFWTRLSSLWTNSKTAPGYKPDVPVWTGSAWVPWGHMRLVQRAHLAKAIIAYFRHWYHVNSLVSWISELQLPGPPCSLAEGRE